MEPYSSYHRNKSVTMSQRPVLHNYFVHMFGAIDVTNSASTSLICEDSGPVSSRQRNGSDLWFFIVFLFPGCWFSCEAIIFFPTMEVTSVFEAHHVLLPSFKLCIIIILSLLFQATCCGFSPTF